MTVHIGAQTAEVRPGNGTPIVIVPGVMADAATWRPVVAGIDLPNPVVTVNRRGRAPSRDLGADYSVGTEIDDLRNTIKAVGEAHLFGWSYGALVAIEAAVDNDLVLSLTAYEPVSKPFAEHALGPLRRASDSGDLDKVIELVNTDVSGFSAAYVADLRRTPAWSVLRPLAAPLARELAAINAFEPSMARYSRLPPPVTLILGEINDGTEPYGTAFVPFAAALSHAITASVRAAEAG